MCPNQIILLQVKAQHGISLLYTGRQKMSLYYVLDEELEPEHPFSQGYPLVGLEKS